MVSADQIRSLSIAWSSPPPLSISAFKKALRRAWLDTFGNICQACNRAMNFSNSNTNNFATIDHITAKALGGNDDLSNIQVICKQCNNTKSILESRLSQKE